jgi:hypothetical protein
MLAAAGSAPAADAPSVDSILAKYVTALGGKATLEKSTSVILKIKMEMEGGDPSDGEILGKAPNKQMSRIELAGIGTMLDGFDGTNAWAKAPGDDVRVKSGDELAKAKRDSEFHRELKLKTIYPDLAFKGTEKVGEEEVTVLESKPTTTSKEQFSFSKKTDLLVRQESEFEGPQGKVNLTVLLQEYKSLEGAKYPSQLKMKFSMGDQTFAFTIKIVELKANVPIDDAKFAKPSA